MRREFLGDSYDAVKRLWRELRKNASTFRGGVLQLLLFFSCIVSVCILKRGCASGSEETIDGRGNSRPSHKRTALNSLAKAVISYIITCMGNLV